MHPMTAANLRSAYGGESMAHMRYIAWGNKAKEDGFPNVGRLFHAISFAEQVHATNHFVELANEKGDFLVPSGAGFGLGSTSDNLLGAINGEIFEVEEMYPVYKEGAKFQGEAGAVRSFHYAVSAERIHADMFAEAKKAVDQGKDIGPDAIQICTICGHTAQGDIPEKCPVCSAEKNKYRTFE